MSNTGTPILKTLSLYNTANGESGAVYDGRTLTALVDELNLQIEYSARLGRGCTELILECVKNPIELERMLVVLYPGYTVLVTVVGRQTGIRIRWIKN